MARVSGSQSKLRQVINRLNIEKVAAVFADKDTDPASELGKRILWAALAAVTIILLAVGG